eukprot:contig_7192_g1674
MGARRSLVVAVAAVTATAAVASSVVAASVAPSDRTFVVVHKPVVVAPTRAPTPKPTPCLVKYDCSTSRIVAAQCPMVVRQAVACHGSGGHKWAAHKLGPTTCYANVTVSRPCNKTVKVARTCVKACATPVPTPCTRSVACNKVETVDVDCSTTTPVVVACPKTAEFFDAAGKPLAICQTLKKTAKTCTKEVVTAAKCVVPCATAKATRAPRATRAPKAAVVQKKGVLGVPTKTWVNLLGKVVTAVVNKKG